MISGIFSPRSWLRVLRRTDKRRCALPAEAINLLKLDVEGAEYQAMRGAEDLFKSHRIARCAFEFGQTIFDMGTLRRIFRVSWSAWVTKYATLCQASRSFQAGIRQGKQSFQCTWRLRSGNDPGNPFRYATAPAFGARRH